jgi:TolA-binding protein
VIQMVFLSFLFLSHVPCFGKPKAKTQKTAFESTYREAQRLFHKGHYSQSVQNFEKYLDMGSKDFNKKGRLFWVIDQVGHMYLRIQNDPDGAIKFFKKYESDSRLNDAQQDSISEWIGVAKDWKKEKDVPQKIKESNKLFSLGKKYFERGIKKKSYPADDKGNADFAIAEAYLRPFIIGYDKDRRIGEVLLMMGRVKYNLRTDLDYWSENYYLKEAIRRFPGTKLAKEAWKKLDEDIHVGYTGSSGDHTPLSVQQMLNAYKELAYLKAPKTKRQK